MDTKGNKEARVVKSPGKKRGCVNPRGHDKAVVAKPKGKTRRDGRKEGKISKDTEKAAVAYNKEYYETGITTGKSLYFEYRWIPEMTIPFAMRIIDYLGIKRGDTILDVGCAKGYLVKALRWLGRDAYGVDISDYAIENADEEVKQYVAKI